MRVGLDCNDSYDPSWYKLNAYTQSARQNAGMSQADDQCGGNTRADGVVDGVVEMLDSVWISQLRMVCTHGSACACIYGWRDTCVRVCTYTQAIEDIEKVEQFYFGKLCDIEQTCDEVKDEEGSTVVQQIRSILHSTTVSRVSILQR